jgi:WD40 repeat protein
MNRKRNWVIAGITAAIAGGIAIQNGLVSPSAEVQSPEITLTFTHTPPPTYTPTYEGCGYMWAYHDDPVLTEKFNTAVQALNPASSANAQLFGEDCVYADGHSTFSTMETDFYVRLPAEDLSKEDDFGNWVGQVMAIITALPDEEVQGRKGFVEFSFIKSDIERIIIRVDITTYSNIAPGISGANLFRNFYTPQPPPTTPVPITPTATP